MSEYDPEKYNGLSLVELATKLHQLNHVKSALKEQGTEIQKEIDLIGMTLIPDMMEDEGVDTMKITGIGRLQLRADAHCSVLAANREGLQDWLRENNHESLIKDTVSAATLKAWVKAQIKEGNVYPTELIKFEAYSKAVVVKA